MNQYQDCAVVVTAEGFTIQNSRISKTVRFADGVPVTERITDVVSGKEYIADGKPCPSFYLPVLDFAQAAHTVRVFTDDQDGLSQTALVAETVFEQGDVCVRWQNVLYPGLPFVAGRLYVRADGQRRFEKTDSRVVSEGNENATLGRPAEEPSMQTVPCDTLEAFGYNSRHKRLTTVMLRDVSDMNNNFVERKTFLPYVMWDQHFEGHFFLFDDYVNGGEGLLLVKEAPCPAGKLCHGGEDLRTQNAGYVMLVGSGLDYDALPSGEETALYGSVIGVGKADNLTELYKEFYRREFSGLQTRGLYAMSNTWGDRSQDKAVCEAFMLRETEAAARMGIDAVQIDDGWMQGRTANSALVSTDLWVSGYYENNPDFWAVDTGATKFPRSLEPVCEAIAQKGLQLGLWFSPDLADEYAAWEKDVQTLVGLHERCGVRFFKLDGIKLSGKRAELRLLKMMREVTRKTAGRVWFNMDITAQIRLGHLYQKQFGSLFVENRYTDSANYYPHWTLKNLWELSPYIPVGKCQFELLNKNRNEERYLSRYPDDPFRPALYPEDTLFAITMLACPLVWMEMSNLPPEDLAAAARIVAVWKRHRNALAAANVRPIGELPDGRAYTGFVAECDAQSGYLLVFREFSEQSCGDFGALLEGAETEILYANCNAEIDTSAGLRVSLEHKACFVFASYRKKAK